MKRPWHNAGSNKPPVSTRESRHWLELYIPDRVQAAETGERYAGLAMGVYLGSGTYRLAGERIATLEKITHWRPLAGNAIPISQEVTKHNADVHGQTGVEAPGP